MTFTHHHQHTISQFFPFPKLSNRRVRITCPRLFSFSLLRVKKKLKRHIYTHPTNYSNQLTTHTPNTQT